MIFNNIINHLKLWCINKAKIYQKVYAEHKGITYIGYLIAYELEFKLSTLIDKTFKSIENLKTEVLNLIDVHYEPSVLTYQNSLAEHIVNETNNEFREIFEEILSRNEHLSLADIPYTRVIIGSEAIALQDRFRSVWRYDNTSYWYPLIGDEPKEIPEKFFVISDYFKPYMKQLKQIIGLPQTHIYCYGENDFRPQHCIETVELADYGGVETIYTDKNFTWAIYFSHEDTITFAGSIVPKVKELLVNEDDHFNKFECDDEI